MDTIKFHLRALDTMKKYPDRLYYKGNTALLDRRKISIIGSRKPNQYTQQMTLRLASELSKVGVCIVSGGAMGVDAIAHRGAGSENTIAVLPSGIDIRYPAVNRGLLEDIEKYGLTLSQFEPGFQATNWSFVVRNEIVVALGEILIVTEADMNSGSMRSVEYALEMGKTIYVLPHRLNESSGTQWLLTEGKAEVIYDIDDFVTRLGILKSKIDSNDPFLAFCTSQPTYEDAIVQYPEKIFEAELSGMVEIRNGRVMIT